MLSDTRDLVPRLQRVKWSEELSANFGKLVEEQLLACRCHWGEVKHWHRKESTVVC